MTVMTVFSNIMIVFFPAETNFLEEEIVRGRGGGGGGGILNEVVRQSVLPFVRITKLYATKLGMMVHHCDPEWHAKRLNSYLHGQGQRAGSNLQNKSACFQYLLNF